MSMTEWAEREVDIACKKERKASGIEDGEWDYGAACYESALKAYKSLMEDGHSGMSIGFTKQILNRLIDGKPLTPIEDVDDVWDQRRDPDSHVSYRCKRMSSLFKDVFNDGRVAYLDLNRVVCYDAGEEGISYYNGFVSKIIHEMFPITMPYYPENKPYKVYTRTFLTDPKNGDFDTKAILYTITPEGKTVRIERYFKEGDDYTLVEIDADEYYVRLETYLKKEE